MPSQRPTSRVSRAAERPPAMNAAAGRVDTRKDLAADTLASGVATGDRRALAQAITLVESTRADDRRKAQRMLGLLPPGQSLRIGVTGPPGVGKSTFIEAFGSRLLELGRKVAALTVDPSSVATRGSILGDKTRMPRLASDMRAFVRPSPSSGALGGVTDTTRATIRLCEAAGFDTVLVETAGVGQSEVDVHAMTDFFLLLAASHAGDELQAIKRGIVEMADAVVVTKADGGNVEASRLARSTYRRALSHRSSPPPVLTCSAFTGEGIDAVREAIESHVRKARSDGRFAARRRRGARTDIVRAVERLVRERILGSAAGDLERLQETVAEGRMTALAAAHELVEGRST